MLNATAPILNAVVHIWQAATHDDPAGMHQLLSRVSQSPEQHLWLLELIHYCLLLGYEGRYRGSDSGRAV